MRHFALLGLAALAAATLPGQPAAAQGLLHKHRHAAGPGLGALRPLPAAVTPTAAGITASDGATAAVIAAAPGGPAVPGSVGGSPGGHAFCVLPIVTPIDGAPVDVMPMPMPSIDGLPVTGIGSPPFDGGFDAGSTVSVGGWPVDVGPPARGFAGHHHPGPLSAAGKPQGGPLMLGRPMEFSSTASAPLSANAFGQATAAAATAAPPGRSVAAGLPGRAAGVRPGQFNPPGRHTMASIDTATGRPTPAPVAAGSGRDAGVVHANHETAAEAARGTGIPPVGAAASPASAPPRWRDRIRFAWPSAN
jgi:hypothetical protein